MSRDTQTQEEAPAAWPPPKRFFFRFLSAYLVLYLLPFPLDTIPLTGGLVQRYTDLWDALVPWAGKRVFHVTITVQPNGSGDTTYNYVQVFCFAALALLAAILWTLLDRRSPHHTRLDAWLRVYVRFSLAATMIGYGAIKVIQSQFPAPTLDRLLEPIGSASPMGLLWTFMGASRSYNAFGGGTEMLGGLLLVTRRTTLLGALVCMGALSNVVMLNFSFDVPVKLLSCHLLAMAVFLALPDLRRLANLFLLNRPTEPVTLRPRFTRRWMNRTALALKTLLVIGFVAVSLWGANQDWKDDSNLSARSAFYGIWNVDEFTTDGQARPPLVTDTARWRRVVFAVPGTVAVQLMSDERQRYGLALDPSKKTLALTRRDDPTWKSGFVYQQPEPQTLTLQGTFDGHQIQAKLHRVDQPKFLLVNRGFHWINENPYNR